jgi:hypothetical protein
MTDVQSLSAPSQALAQGGWVPALLLPAAATTVVYTTMFLFRPDGAPAFVGQLWFPLLVLAAPVAAVLMNRRRPVATTMARAWLLGLPQLPIAVGLMWLAIWLDVRSGYLLAGSGEVQMALGFGTLLAAGIGLLLTVLVAAAARFGARGHRPRGQRQR